jgi:nicotinamide-nucleotide amidase
MRVEVINTGSELLLGQVINTNVVFLGQKLAELGIKIERQSSVPDGDVIKDVLSEAINRSELIIITGGLGPTHDDVSKEMAAELLDIELEEDLETLDEIRKKIESNGSKMREINAKQAMVPKGAVILKNNNGTAPGIYLNHSINGNGVHIFLLPGPPRELNQMYNDSVDPILRVLMEQDSDIINVCKNLFFSGLGESELASRINEIIDSSDSRVEYGYCLKPGGIIFRCVGEKRVVFEVQDKVKDSLREYYLGDGVSSLQEFIVKDLKSKGESLSLAESCTGGLIASLITNVPGASMVFNVGQVTYSNSSKVSVLDVPVDLISRHGAVSQEVVISMAEGSLIKSNSDHSLAVSGIAGPSGATPNKPVGTVFIGLASKGKKTLVFNKVYQADRISFKEKVSMFALDLLRQRLNLYI